MKKADLTKAMNELNEILFAPADFVKAKDLNAEGLATKVLEAAALLVPEDEISETTRVIIETLKGEKLPLKKETPKKETPKEEPKEEIPEASIEEQIAVGTFKELQQMVGSLPEFKKAKSALKNFKSKDLETLRATMLNIVTGEEPEAEKEVEKPVAKETPKKNKKEASTEIPVNTVDITIGNKVSFKAAASHALSGQDIEGVVTIIKWEARSAKVYCKIADVEGNTFHKVITALTIIK